LRGANFNAVDCHFNCNAVLRRLNADSCRFNAARESSGAVQLSQIQTDKLLAHAVGVELEKRKKAGSYEGKYGPLCHYFGYQVTPTPTAL
jgi:hypothetical protein